MNAAELITIMEAAVRLRCRVTIRPDGRTEFEPLDAAPEPTRSAGAERIRRYRERQAAALRPVTEALQSVTQPLQGVTEALQSVTQPLQGVTEALQSVTQPLQGVTEALQSVTKRHIPENSPSPSPPSPSLPAPLPSPPTSPASPQGNRVRTCAKEPEETAWIDDFDIPEPSPKAAPVPTPEPKPKRTSPAADPEAVAVTLPPTASAKLREAWTEWQEYRQSRASAKLAADRIPWTGNAARTAAKQFVEHAARLGDWIVRDRVASAISGHWRGLNLHDIATPKPHEPHYRNSPPNRNGTSQPLPEAVDLNRLPPGVG
jgi:hypothetical protein